MDLDRVRNKRFRALAFVVAALVWGACAESDEFDGAPCERCDEEGGVALNAKPQRFTEQPLGECWTEGNVAICQDLLMVGRAFFEVRFGDPGSEVVSMRHVVGGRFEAFVPDGTKALTFFGSGQSPTSTTYGVYRYPPATAEYQRSATPVVLPGPDVFVIGLVSSKWMSLHLEVIFTLNGEEVTQSNRLFFLEREQLVNSDDSLWVHRAYQPIDPGTTIEVDEAGGGICWGLDLSDADWLVVDGCPEVLEPGELETLLGT